MTDWEVAARGLADDLRRSAAEVDREGRFPTESIARLRAAGYLSMSLRAPHGTDADLATVCRAQAALARGCGSTALAANMHLFAVGFHAEAERAGESGYESLLTEAAGGKIVGGTFSGALARGGDDPVVARPIPGGYVVNGRRPFCSMAPVLDVCFGTARVDTVDGKDGEDREDGAAGEATPPAISFWLPRSTRGLSFDDTWDTLGMRGTASFDMVLEDVLLPHFFVGPQAPGGGWSAAGERTMAWFTLTISAVYLGIAEEAAGVTHRLVAGGKGTGATRVAGEVALELATARALLHDTLLRRSRGPLDQADLAAAKIGVTQRCAAVAERCLTLLGGRSLSRSVGVERLFRDLQAARFHPPSDEAALDLLGRAWLTAGPEVAP